MKNETKWRLRDPKGNTYGFDKLIGFVKEHPHLFSKEHAAAGKRGYCDSPAYRALMCLHPNRKPPTGSWFGWTFVLDGDFCRNLAKIKAGGCADEVVRLDKVGKGRGSPSHRENRREFMLKMHSECGYKPEWAEARNAAVRGSEKHKKQARKNLIKGREGIVKSPRCQKDQKNANAVIWRIRDPLGRSYEFKNLCWFLRELSHLFDPDDLFGEVCKSRAYSGLAQIKPYGRGGRPVKRPRGSWKGWTWVSSLEKCRDFKDLLER